MPRPPRSDEAGCVYHALNRANGRHRIFRKDQDFEAFERVIRHGQQKYAIELFAYQWMSNHWHMVLRPLKDGEMSRFLYWITMTHTARYHAHYHTTGQGHVYQGRFKSFPIEDDHHFLTACRYVERNALAAGIVERAEMYRWGSLWNWCGGDSKLKLASWPVARLPNWVQRVNESLHDEEKKQFQKCLHRSCPFGSEQWVSTTAKRFGLESTLRARGRPRRFAQSAK